MPSALAHQKPGKIALVGTVVGPIAGGSHTAGGLRFGVRDIGKKGPVVHVVYHGDSPPPLFAVGRNVVVDGTYLGGRVQGNGILTKCPSKYTRRPRARATNRWLSWVAQRSSSASGWRSTRCSPARTRRITAGAVSPTPRGTRCSPASRSTVIASAMLVQALVRHDFSFVYVASHTNRTLPTVYALSAFWGGQEGSLLLWLLILTGYGALAIALNRKLLRDLVVWVVPGDRRDRDVLRVRARLRRKPVRHADRAARRSRPDAEPAEPVHGRAPADAVPRLRRAVDPVRVRVRRDALRPHRRALDHRDAPLDARRVDVPRLRPAARLALGVRRGGVGRLLRVGPGGERRAHAVARRDRVPALGDDPGAQGDAEGLEHGARRACVRALGVRHVPHALGRRELDPLVREELDRRLVPGVRRDLVGVRGRADPLAAAAAEGAARSWSRRCRARRRSSTTTCCSSRSASPCSGACCSRSSRSS